MKLEDLKNSRLGNRSGHPWLFGLFVQDFGLPAVQVTFGDAYDFNDPQTALLAAARFRASEEMYQALRAAVDDHDAALASSLKYAEARGEIVHIIEPEWVEQARKALAMADNTNETL